VPVAAGLLRGGGNGLVAGPRSDIARSVAGGGEKVPEGPEIRRAADRIERSLAGSVIHDVRLTLPRLRRFRSELIGARVTGVDTRGKAMLTRFDNGLTLYSHNQLYGRWYITRRNALPKTRRSLRVALHGKTHSAWLYSATEEQLGQHPFLRKLGPDVLDSELKPRDIRMRLEMQRFRRRNLAALYLDQAFLAGVGNYLRSEILFTAGLHPLARPKDLDRADLQRLARATLTISRRAYELKGVTVTPRLMESLKRAGQRYQQYRHWVFARYDEPCRRCETGVERELFAGRAVFFCPYCQAEGASQQN
jgi:endonuclease-8